MSSVDISIPTEDSSNEENGINVDNKSSRNNLLLWAGVGFIFLINALITRFLVKDDLFLSSTCALLATLVMLVPLVKLVISDLKKGEMRMHELAVIAVVASAVQGASDGFISSAAIAFFMLLSVYIETRTASGVKASLEALAKLSPGKARRVLADGSSEMVEPADLKTGDILRIQPGENILADGLISDGRSAINEANISGESLPVDKATGDKVFAGTTNINGLLDIKVTRAGKDTTIGRIRELIMKAEGTRLPFSRLIDSYIRYYIPIIITATGLILYFNRFEPDMLNRIVAALVIACPVALILATPTAAVASLSAAARSGVLIKDINHIEAMARADAFIFDKTGTLTRSELKIAAVHPLHGQPVQVLLKAALIAEAASTHPVARAVREFALKTGLKEERPDHLHEEPGRGMKADWQNKRIIVGNLRWMEDNGLSSEDFGEEHTGRGHSMSLLFVAIDGKPVGWIGLSDTVRDDSGSSLQELREQGIRWIGIVSGDRQPVVDVVGEELQTEGRFGGCSPEDKVSHITRLRKKGFRIIFVGDGVNDGPALANADIGISMGAAGSDVAIESSTVALMNNKLNRLPFLVRLSRSMRLIIVQNFILGALIIAGGLSLAAMGSLNPVIAAALQVAGSLIVVMNSARLVRQGENLDENSEDSP